MPKLPGIICLLMLSSGLLQAQDRPDSAAHEKITFVIDGIPAGKDALSGFSPNDIASITVIKDTSAPGSGETLYILTKMHARQLYTAMFRRFSPAYDSLMNRHDNDSSFQYILNGTVLPDPYSADLAGIDPGDLTGLSVLTPAALLEQYHISGKTAGILIQTRKER